jgi:hypothetical protein
MAYFMHLAIWPPKSSLTPNSEKLCDIIVECWGGGGGIKFYKWSIHKNFKFQKHILFVKYI